MILGAIASGIGALSTSVGTIAALPAYALLTMTLRITEWTSAWPLASIPVYDIGTSSVIAYYLALLVLTTLIHQPTNTRQVITDLIRKYVRTGTLLITAGILLTAGGVYWYQRPDGKLHVTLAGAGAFIQTPSGKQVVFAGGGGVLPVMGRAMPLWDKGVELLILPWRNDYSRNDTLPILQRYRVGTVIQPDGEDDPSDMLDAWSALTETNAVRVLSPPIGTRAIIEPGVVLTIEQRVERNGYSAIGARLTYGSTTFELAGDTNILSGTLDGADVVFVSVDGGSLDALNAAQPRYVVWADAGGAPGRLDNHIRAFTLRDKGVMEFASDGTTITVR
jgi:hypothetical protein